MPSLPETPLMVGLVWSANSETESFDESRLEPAGGPKNFEKHKHCKGLPSSQPDSVDFTLLLELPALLFFCFPFFLSSSFFCFCGRLSCPNRYVSAPGNGAAAA